VGRLGRGKVEGIRVSIVCGQKRYADMGAEEDPIDGKMSCQAQPFSPFLSFNLYALPAASLDKIDSRWQARRPTNLYSGRGSCTEDASLW